MNGDIFFAVVFFGLAIASCFLWRRLKDKGYFWMALFSLIAFLASVFDYSANYIFHLSLEIRQVSYYLQQIVILPVTVIFSLAMMFKKRKDKN